MSKLFNTLSDVLAPYANKINLHTEEIEEIQSDVSEVKVDINTTFANSGLYDVKQSEETYWQQGWWGAASGVYDGTKSTAVCTILYLDDTLFVECLEGYKMRLQAWNANGTYVGVWNGTTFVTSNPKYFKRSFDISDFRKKYENYNYKIVLFADNETDEVTVNDANNVSFTYSSIKSLIQTDDDLKNYLYGVYDYTPQAIWEIGSIYGSGGAGGVNYNENTKAIRTSSIFIPNDSTAFSLNDSIITLYAFKYEVGGAYVERLGTQNKRIVKITGGYNYRFVGLTGTDITEETILDYSNGITICGQTLAELLTADLSGTITVKGSVVGLDLIKRHVQAERIGTQTLKYDQSFLIYNSKYYSTNGSNIAIQDSDFNVEQDVELYVGHGNSFQLGYKYPNRGYVSGWDDNKVYIVNLDNLTLESTINLPVTGYTTCAVDDINGLVYIFQRDTRPNTESIYNLIIYDYINSETKKTYTLSTPFGAMQACDIFQDKIIVLNGLGTNALPNGYRVYDTTGQILATYHFDDFDTIEPEGVFIDRTSGEMYWSFANARIYKVYG